MILLVDGILDGAHVSGGVGLDTAAVLFAELDTAVSAEADDADEAEGPDEGDDEAGFGDAGVEGLSRHDEGGGADDGGRGGS